MFNELGCLSIGDTLHQRKWAFLEAISLFNKNPSAGGSLLCYRLLTKQAPEGPHIIKAIPTAVSCMPELDRKALLLKTPPTLVAGQGEVKLGLN